MTKKRVLILGQDGYIGTALTAFLKEKGHYVRGIDDGSRERNVKEIGSESLVQKTSTGAVQMSVTSPELPKFLKEFKPDAIVHLAEQPSAPFSMIDAQHAVETQENNIGGTLRLLWAMREVCPDAHLIKLGTEGEYPDWLWDGKHIPEGNRMKVHVTGAVFRNNAPLGGEVVSHHEWEIPTPHYAGSWYHWSKVHDSMNIDYACRIWGLTATDVNQGVVYGHVNGTRFDYDEHFGTVVHRFITQAVAGMPLTVYGEGNQTRGFIALQNSIEAIELLIQNPPKKGQFRVIHQTTKEYSVNKIAEMVKEVSGCEINHIENPRAEMGKNHFTFDNSTLLNLGLKPVEMRGVIEDLYKMVKSRSTFIRKDVIIPKTKWR